MEAFKSAYETYFYMKSVFERKQDELKQNKQSINSIKTKIILL